MYPQELINIMLRYGPRFVAHLLDKYKNRGESIGSCCCCSKKLMIGEDIKFDMTASEIVLCCNSDICRTFMQIKLLGETRHEFFSEKV